MRLWVRDWDTVLALYFAERQEPVGEPVPLPLVLAFFRLEAEVVRVELRQATHRGEVHTAQRRRKVHVLVDGDEADADADAVSLARV